MIDEREAGEAMRAFRALGSASISYEGADGMHHGGVDAYEVWRALPQAHREHVAGALWSLFVKGEAPRRLPSDRFTRNAGQVLRIVIENLSYAVDAAMPMPVLPGDPANEVAEIDRDHREGVVPYLRLKVRYEGTIEAIIELAHQQLVDYGTLPSTEECFLISATENDQLLSHATALLKANRLAAKIQRGRRGSQYGYYLTVRRDG